MSVSIGTNVASLLAAHHLRSNRQELTSAMTRLASGKRINSAADDAAGVGVASSLKAQAKIPRPGDEERSDGYCGGASR